MVMKQLLLAFAAAVLWGSVLVSAQANFQFYKLSMMWPYTICLRATCITPVPNYFTIHGLWPTFQDGNDEIQVPEYNPITNPCFTNPVDPITATSPDTLGPILDGENGLNEKWPNLIVTARPNPNQYFWQLEWVRHGVCSDYGADPFSYFNIALNLAIESRLDPFTVMEVQPSTTTPYQINTLLANVQRNVGFLPQISCYSDGTYLYLKEFRLCFVRATPPAYLQDCPNVIDNACGSVQNSVWIYTSNSGNHVSWE